MKPSFELNGAIYLIKTKVLLEMRSFYSNKTYAYFMPRERSLDIDTLWDLHLVDLVLRDQQANSVTKN